MEENNLNVIKVMFPDNSEREVFEGISLLELSKDCEENYKSTIVAAKVNNDIKELSYHLYESCRVEFIDLTYDDGMRIYRRSLNFILIKAVNDLFPDRKVVICHSISKGIYCEVEGKTELNAKEVEMIEERMRELVKQRIPFIKKIMSLEDASEMFKNIGRMDRYYAVQHRNKPYVTIYDCDGFEDYFYGYMVPDTGYLKEFQLKYYHSGLIMLYPQKTNPDEIPEFKEQKKLFSIFKEYKNWVRILGAANVGSLNDMIKKGCVNEIIRISEALHEKKIAQIADMIAFNKHKKKVVLIAGPSSSGKTTFAHRLSIQLRVNGLRPVTVSLDDYFVNRENTPKDEDGDYDFEALEAIDIKLFNQHLSELTQGKEVDIPIFNFPNGCREEYTRKLKIDDDQLLIIEGIHGLNNKLTASIKKDKKFKIYISALTSMNIDDHNRIPTTDTRFIRRIVRDHQFRGCSAVNTISRWPSVRRGEEKNIFPFQEESDVMFNSSLIFELGVLKILAEPLLMEVDQSQPEYSEAKRLIEFLGNFLSIDSKEIPINSIIREFIGDSCFYK
ncbi:nucleoside kinase [Herbivorax sp. ANBcel31]|uniref:nucleoside kinase n=1 Tax=Herbivorax sp. ANBcel31 TaxID=3069754 RepID=UPI0027B1867A|nr:nucleoside kinase [Herbivorax sp. ANBcel31]MDQ2085459.1 nucleoside kinase [Herbivorax sp. ANBcel31]